MGFLSLTHAIKDIKKTPTKWEKAYLYHIYIFISPYPDDVILILNLFVA